MPEIIDSLVVTLGLDPAAFTAGQKQAAAALAKLNTDTGAAQKKATEQARKAAKEQEESGNRIADAYRKSASAALAFFGLLTAGRGIRALTAETTEAAASVGRVAYNLDVSTKSLNAYQQAAQRVGGTSQGITSAFQAIQANIQNFRLYGQELNPSFRGLGVQPADPRTGKARSTLDIYRDVLERLHARPAEERPAIVSNLGMGQETLGLAALDRPARERLLQEMEKQGAVTDDQAKAAQHLQNAWSDLQQTFDSLWREFQTPDGHLRSCKP